MLLNFKLNNRNINNLKIRLEKHANNFKKYERYEKKYSIGHNDGRTPTLANAQMTIGGNTEPMITI